MIFGQILLVLLFLTTSLLALLADECGIGGKPSGLIVNGVQSNRGAWPWIVSIFEIKKNQLLCGGSLVSSDFVITAAHCIQDKRQATPRSPNDIVIKIGHYDLSQTYQRGAIDAYADDIIVHPDWKFFTQNFDSDIAIIKLTTAVAFNDVIFPICIWSSNERLVETSGIIVGYGKSENVNILHENTPRELPVTILTNEKCFLKNPRLVQISSENTFCAGKDEKSGACKGDSGNGLFIQHNNRWFLRGIVSASLLAQNQCDISSDAIYTDVLKFLDWIRDKISITFSRRVQQTSTSNKISNKRKEIVCYIASWAIYRKNGGKFSLDNFKPELCTTAIYHFVGIDDDSNLTSLDPYSDLEDDYGLNGYKLLTSLKQSNPHLRVLLSVGGWDEGVVKYSALAANESRRKRFASQSAEFLKRYDFDGLNFYWDFPGDMDRGGKPEDMENYAILLKAIADVYRQQNLYLSVTMKNAPNSIENIAYNMNSMAEHVDAINMMTFDYSGSWDEIIGLPAALRGRLTESTIEATLKLFLDAKIPPNKLILGIPFYARTFRVAHGYGNIGDVSEKQGFVGPIVDSDELLGYNELCRMQKQFKWLLKFDKNASQMIGKFINKSKLNVAVYDTPRSVANKVKYAVDNGLLGVWAWSIDTDDFTGECGEDLTTYEDFGDNKPTVEAKHDFQLLRTMNEAMNATTKFVKNSG